MVNREELDLTYLDMALTWSELSHATRKKVGCLIVKDGQIISNGINGMPSGASNVCEDSDGKTKPEVLHAESNAISKLARGTQSGEGATAYLTLSPCLQCAKLLHQTGIKEVFFTGLYRESEGVSFLLDRGVRVVMHISFDAWRLDNLEDVDHLLCYAYRIQKDHKGLEIPGIREIANENIPKMRKVQPVYKMDWGIFTLMNNTGDGMPW